ncbi:hypothetical protein [Nonomuraea sp. NPDC049400]|uniref:hypothetical protein n=1 Tax=Nonomuraea sp. NPDC049400 TaxID=3364352 RepID=UPI0037AC7C79
MSDGFKMPVPGETPDPSEPGGDGPTTGWRVLQEATLAMLGISMVAFPGAVVPVLLGVLRTYPGNPQLLFKAAEGWSRLGDSTYAAGHAVQKNYDRVSQATWHAQDRAAYGERVAGISLSSVEGQISAARLSNVVRWLGNIKAAWFEFAFAVAAYLVVLAAVGGGTNPHAVMRAAAARSRFDVRSKMLTQAVTAVISTLASAGAAWGYKSWATDGLGGGYDDYYSSGGEGQRGKSLEA